MTTYRWLDQRIEDYVNSGIYPFHMPGAKRVNPGIWDPFQYDITEIEGFDDLRESKGILKELQDMWAGVYGADEAYLSVNGSTGSNLSVIFAATSRHDRLLAAASCHPSVSNAGKLRGLSIDTIPAKRLQEGFLEPSSPEELERLFQNGAKPSAVVVTSPTYEGIVADIKALSAIAHSNGAALIADSAHGAHFGREMSRCFANPIEEGADAAVVSLHKTLPVLGQLSLILLKNTGDCRIKGERVKHYLNMLQTSSPSYLLMSSAALCCRNISEKGRALFAEYGKRLDEFYSGVSDLKHIYIVDRDDKDRSKIIISTVNTGLSGKELTRSLREEYRLELEKYSDGFALALSSVMDTKEGFDRLSAALHEIDRAIR